MAMRPGYGSCGYTTKVQANHFKLQIKVQFQWLTVTFDPPLHTKEEKLEFWESAKGNNDCLTNTYFDGYDKAVVIGEVPTILVFNPTIFNQCKNNLSEKCDVILKVRFGPLSEDDELRAFDLILREKLRSKRLIIDSIFLLPETRIELDKGVQAWTGFRLTSHHTQTGTCLVIDRKTLALFASAVSSHVSQLLPRHNFSFPLADLQRITLQEKIGRVVYNSKYGRLSVLGLSDKPKQDLRIKFADVDLARDKMGDKVDMSADDYFEQSCGFESSSLNGALPVVLVRTRPYYLPMELCVIVKKESYSELNSKQRKSLGGITQTLPELLGAIMEDSHVVSRRMENSHFGFEHELLTFDARVLPNPQPGGIIAIVKKNPSLEDGAFVFGIATSHVQKKSASAVVVSIDWPVLSQYKSVAKMCQGDEYEPKALLPIICTLLDELRDSGIRPSRMVFYRDGLRGDNNSVFLDEIDVIKKACKFRGIDAPSITYVVAQRFHNTCLYPMADDTPTLLNVVQGTVVDTDICHSSQFDFYLRSRPVGEDLDYPIHYSVVVDDIGFSADDIQQFTYALCFTHVDCVGPTEIVSPILHGRLAAEREIGDRPATE